MDNFKSTKFALTVLVLLLSYVLVFVGKLDAKTWFEFATIGLGLYSGANVLQKFANPT
jgi:hypothetical protein